MKRFEAYGWHIEHVKDGDHDLQGIEDAIRKCQQVKDKPSVIKLTTTIGFGSKLQGTGGVHGIVDGAMAGQNFQDCLVRYADEAAVGQHSADRLAIGSCPALQGVDDNRN